MRFVGWDYSPPPTVSTVIARANGPWQSHAERMDHADGGINIEYVKMYNVNWSEAEEKCGAGDSHGPVGASE